jgi:hypothetical protein
MRSRFAFAALAGLLMSCGQHVAVPDAQQGDAQDDRPDVPQRDVGDDVQGTNLPNGSICNSDSQCESHVCVLSPDLTPGCASPCTVDDDCAGQGVGVYCAVDRAPSGGRLVCAAIDGGATGFEGDVCTVDHDCVNDLCLGHVCHGPCAADDECTPGSRCVMQTVAGGQIRACGYDAITGPVVEDYTVYDSTQFVDRGPNSYFVVPDDVVSLTFIAQDMEGSDLYASVPSLVAPDGTAWIDSASWNGVVDQPVREILGAYQINSALAPSSDTLHVQQGQYQAIFTLFNDTMAGTHIQSRRTRALVRVKRAPGGMLPDSGTLHMRLFFVGVSGVSASSAPTNSALQRAIHGMQAVYATVGVDVVVDGYAVISGTDASTFSVVDTEEEFEQLLTRSASTTGDVLNLFFVRSVSMSAGLEGAIGVAGDIVGPPGIHGTIHSGVVVGWESTMGFGGPTVTAQVMAHECGHYLGLWHTQESQPACTGMLGPGCSPFGSVDPISDTPGGRASEPYLMNWFTSDGSNTTLSSGEGIVMRSNPLVQ